MGLPRRSAVYQSGNWEIDLIQRRLRVNDIRVPLGGTAFEIMVILVQAAGKLVTKRELLEGLWADTTHRENALHAQISAIRKALGSERGLIIQISGRGYRLLGDWQIRDESVPDSPLVPYHRTLGTFCVESHPEQKSHQINAGMIVASVSRAAAAVAARPALVR